MLVQPQHAEVKVHAFEHGNLLNKYLAWLGKATDMPTGEWAFRKTQKVLKNGRSFIIHYRFYFANHEHALLFRLMFSEYVVK